MQVQEQNFSDVLNAGRDEMKSEVLYKITAILIQTIKDNDLNLAQKYYDVLKIVKEIPERWQDTKVSVKTEVVEKEISGIEVLI
jgi:hypothetical protein